MQFKYAIALTTCIASSALAAGSCNADNCLRAIRATASPKISGSADCQSYFVATVTPAASTTTVFATVTTSTTASDFAVSTVTVTSTLVDASTIPVQKRSLPHHDPLPQSLINKRQVVTNGPKTSVPTGIPSYASACSGSVRYNSACSCVGATMSTTFAATPVVTVTITGTQTVVSATTVSTITTTTELISTTTVSYASPTCNPIAGGYRLIYAGPKTLNPNNPGNTAAAAKPITFTYDGTLTTCQAAIQCANSAHAAVTPIGMSYFSFNLQFHEGAQQWICVAYYDPNTAAYFNVDDPDVKRSYGWSN